MDKNFVMIGAVLMFLGVGAGAFGAHGLAAYFARFPDLESTYDTAVRYQIIHAFAIIITAWIVTQYGSKYANWAGWLFLVGIILFSGSLYLLVITQTRWLGAITPLGGVAFLAGWVMVFLAAWRS